jgi:hypothetical protein
VKKDDTPIPHEEDVFEDMNFQTLPDSTPRREGGDDAIAETSKVINESSDDAANKEAEKISSEGDDISDRIKEKNKQDNGY